MNGISLIESGDRFLEGYLAEKITEDRGLSGVEFTAYINRTFLIWVDSAKKYC